MKTYKIILAILIMLYGTAHLFQLMDFKKLSTTVGYLKIVLWLCCLILSFILVSNVPLVKGEIKNKEIKP